MRSRLRTLRLGPLGWVVLFIGFAVTALGQTELELLDGTVIVGTAVRRDGGEYVLMLEDGGASSGIQ